MDEYLYTQWRRIRRALGLTTMHGVRYGNGSREMTGFRSKRDARLWAQDNIRYDVNAVFFQYEPVETWLPEAAAQRKAHVTVDSSVPPPRMSRPPSNRPGL